MVKIEMDVVNPNLQVFEFNSPFYNIIDKSSGIILALDFSEFLSTARVIDEIIRENIGELKVAKSDLEVVLEGRVNKSREILYSEKLKEYLDALAIRAFPLGIKHDSAEVFDLNYEIEASTIESLRDLNQWRCLQEDIKNPQKIFDEEDRDLVFKVDRKKSLIRMKQLYKDLNKKLPDSFSHLYCIAGELSFNTKGPNGKYIFRVNLSPLKEQGKEKVEKTKSQLIERLKGIKGPCLSLDTENTLNQIRNLYLDSEELLQRYGDVLVNPGEWRNRLFRYDP